MRSLRVLCCAAGAVLAAPLFAQPTGAAGTSQIYQQRTADGRIVFSDRPDAKATTQRTWQFAPENAADAQQRRDDARREADAVSERIQRQLDAQQQREDRLAVERARLAEAQAQRDAERARLEAAQQPLIVAVPRRFVPAAPHPAPHAVPPLPRPPHPPRPTRPAPPRPKVGAPPGERSD